MHGLAFVSGLSSFVPSKVKRPHRLPSSLFRSSDRQEASVWSLVRQARYLRRYREIARVLASHGFGLLVQQLGMAPLISLPRRVLRRPITQLTAAQRLR